MSSLLNVYRVKSVFEMDGIKFTLFLSNNGLGNFELKYNFETDKRPVTAK